MIYMNSLNDLYNLFKRFVQILSIISRGSTYKWSGIFHEKIEKVGRKEREDAENYYLC